MATVFWRDSETKCGDPSSCARQELTIQRWEGLSLPTGLRFISGTCVHAQDQQVHAKACGTVHAWIDRLPAVVANFIRRQRATSVALAMAILLCFDGRPLMLVIFSALWRNQIARFQDVAGGAPILVGTAICYFDPDSQPHRPQSLRFLLRPYGGIHSFSRTRLIVGDYCLLAPLSSGNLPHAKASTVQRLWFGLMLLAFSTFARTPSYELKNLGQLLCCRVRVIHGHRVHPLSAAGGQSAAPDKCLAVISPDRASVSE